MKDRIFALVDCNNFFASCERAFRPDLEGVPVAVLSSNDGCIIARSNEVKALGIPMGAPLFKFKSILTRNNVQLFSSNFKLYGEMSKRVMKIIRSQFLDVQVYSIDEAFIDLKNFKGDINSACRDLRDLIRRSTGIPVSIGIAPTKTLAKLANHISKKNPDKYQGLLNLTEIPDLDPLLEKVEVGDIWGIGWKLSKFLRMYGILTAKDLKYTDFSWIKSHLHVHGERCVLELQGVSCMDELKEAKSHTIASTRSFGKAVFTLEELSQAVTSHVETAASKLRQKHFLASEIMVFIRSNEHKTYLDYYGRSASIKMMRPTSYTPEIAMYAHQALEQIFKPGFEYKKCGVILLDILKKDSYQFQIGETPESENIVLKKDKFIKAVDYINTKMGRNSLKLASEGFRKKWISRSSLRSPNYTTRWDEIRGVS